MKNKTSILSAGFVLIVSCLCEPAISQAPRPVSFYTPANGNTQASNSEICAKTGSFMSEPEVEALVTMIVNKYNGTENRFSIVSCDRIANCEALSLNGTPYILYNPQFLSKVKTLNFTTSDISGSMQDWQTLTVLAHEIGHHLNYHFTAVHPEATRHSMELEADRTAGFIMCRLGATLDQAQSIMYSPYVSDHATMTHPSRDKRLEAIKEGYLRAKGNTNRVDPVIPKPVPPNPVNPTPLPPKPEKPDLPCLQNTAPGYLGLTGMSCAGGAIVLWGIGKYNAANNWYTRQYKKNPANYSSQDFDKNYNNYTTNSRIAMGAGAAVIAVGTIVFIQKIAKVSANNRNCLNGGLSEIPQPTLKLEPLLQSQSGIPTLGVALQIQGKK